MNNNRHKGQQIKILLFIIYGILGALISCVIIISALERDLYIESSMSTYIWSTYNSPDGNFSIALPIDEPDFGSDRIPISDTEDMVVDTYMANIEDTYLFTITFADIPQSLIIDDVNGALLDTLEGMLSRDLGTSLESSEMFSLDNYSAMRFVINGETEAFWNRGIIVFDDNREYIVQFYNIGDFDKRTYNKFINSFKIKNKL